MGSLNLEGSRHAATVAHADAAARSTPAPFSRTAGRTVFRGHTWHTYGRVTRSSAQANMKAAVFAALATTAAALRPVTRRNLGPAGLGLATGLAYRQHAVAADFQKTGSGLQYLDLKEGTGATPEPGQTVQVHYNGWLDDFGDAGRKFDSSLDRGRPLSFAVGTGRVIKGWDEALLTMKVGGKRRVIIPPELGYGSKGIGPIPGGATLYFEMNLMAVK